MNFNTKRTGTGTTEWAEVNENICRGCSNDCLYCYAAANAKRFKLRDRNKWHIEEFTKRAEIKSYPAKKGVIMFPSAHDITPFNVDEYIRVALLMLGKGNKVLMVSKPRLECVRRMVDAFGEHKEQILFRFTIGSMSPKISRFWEPGAPLPRERVRCLTKAYLYGFKTSVSIEPMLSGVQGAESVVREVQPFITDTIWIGKMNKTKLRVDMSVSVNKKAVDSINNYQSDDQIMSLYDRNKDNQIIRWKDSIRSVVLSNQ